MLKNPDADFLNLKGDELGGALVDKINAQYRYLFEVGTFANCQLAYQRYYAPLFTGGLIGRSGKQAQFRNIVVNEFRSIVDASFSLITSEKPALKCQALNTDAENEKSTILGDQLIENGFQDLDIESKNRKATLISLLMGEGFTLQLWDPFKGSAFVPNEQGQVQTQGDISPVSLCLLDVIRDPFSPSFDDCEWFICRVSGSKLTLAHNFPQFEDKILGQDASRRAAKGTSRLAFERPFFFDDPYKATQNTDIIPAYFFFHKKVTNRAPEGKQTLFLGDGTILVDGPLQYERIPLDRSTPSDNINGPFGYTPFWDLLPLQQSINSSYSIIETNQKLFGVQAIWCREGDQLQLKRLDEGPINITTKDVEPKGINFTNTASEIPEHIDRLTAATERLSGANSVVRGQPTANLDTGIAIAQVQAAAVQYNSPAIESWVKLNKNTGYTLLTILRNHANTPRVTRVAGVGNRYTLESFQGSDLQGISGVTTSIINPNYWGPAGKAARAEQYMNLGFIKSPEQFEEVIETGKITPLFDSSMKAITWIKEENERLLRGEAIEPIKTQNPQLHTSAHAELLDLPEVQNNPELLMNILTHIAKHDSYWAMATPMDYARWGIQPLAVPAQAAPPGAPMEAQGMSDAAGAPLVEEPPALSLPENINPLAAAIIEGQQSTL